MEMQKSPEDGANNGIVGRDVWTNLHFGLTSTPLLVTTTLVRGSKHIEYIELIDS